jgi:hypothetical protein
MYSIEIRFGRIEKKNSLRYQLRASLIRSSTRVVSFTRRTTVCVRSKFQRFTYLRRSPEQLQTYNRPRFEFITDPLSSGWRRAWVMSKQLRASQNTVIYAPTTCDVRRVCARRRWQINLPRHIVQSYQILATQDC